MQSGWLHERHRQESARPALPEASPAPTEATGAEPKADVSRRGFIQSGLAAGLAAGTMVAQATGVQVAQAQTTPAAGDTPLGPKWWPSKWGAQDESGASNLMTPAKVLETVRLIKTGKIYEMGRVYEAGIPAFGTRVFVLRIPGTPSGGPFGKNQLVYHDEFVASEIGQIGTQFDGLGHIGCQTGKPGDMAEMRFYNGFTELDMADANGLKKLGIENVKPFFTHGVLVDVAALKGRMLNAGEEITPADVTAALQKQGIAEASIRPGDAVFFNTGWGSLWMKDNAKFNSGEPGIGLDVARWCVQKELALVGADTWATEVVPNPNPDLAFIVHNELITKNGIFNHENLDFTSLIDDKVYEFVYVFTPLRIKGGTGSPGRPIAIA